MNARGFSLIESLLSVAILSLLTVAFYGTLASSLRGISTDRLTESKRFVTQDLLERFCHEQSDIGSLISSGASDTGPLERMLSIDEALALTGLPADAASSVAITLKEGGVTGFRIVWLRGVLAGPGSGPRTLRLDSVWCIPALTGTSPGPRVDSFRVFATRAGS